MEASHQALAVRYSSHRNNAMQNHSTGEKVGVEGRADVVAHEVMKKILVLRIKGGLAGPGTDCEA